MRHDIMMAMMAAVLAVANAVDASPAIPFPISDAAALDDDAIWKELLEDARFNAFANTDNIKNDEFADNELDFPELTREQQEFGVNPGYDTFAAAADQPTLLNKAVKTALSDNNDAGLINDDESVARSESKFGSSLTRASKKASLDEQSRLDLPLLSRLEMDEAELRDLYFTGLVAGGSALAVFFIVSLGFCYHRARRNSKASEDVDYPAYGVTGPGGKESPNGKTGDRKLAQNAHMYHYQHQKQQMIAFDRANGHRNGVNGHSEEDSDQDNEEADYTVYECPGLATGGEMEVHNPLFQDESGSPKKKSG